jgi:hypothetical protein
MSLKNGDRDHVGVKDSSADLGLVLSRVEGMTSFGHLVYNQVY